MTDYSKIPAHMQDTARLYVERGIRGGSFFDALVCNDLMGAMVKADDMNQAAMMDWCRFLYNEAPALCFGSPDQVAAWVERGGTKGHAFHDEPEPLDAETVSQRQSSTEQAIIDAGRGHLIGGAS